MQDITIESAPAYLGLDALKLYKYSCLNEMIGFFYFADKGKLFWHSSRNRTSVSTRNTCRRSHVLSTISGSWRSGAVSCTTLTPWTCRMDLIGQDMSRAQTVIAFQCWTVIEQSIWFFYLPFVPFFSLLSFLSMFFFILCLLLNIYNILWTYLLGIELTIYLFECLNYTMWTVSSLF